MTDPADDPKAARQQQRAERRARSQRQYEMLEQARRARHANTRRAIGEATRLRRPASPDSAARDAAARGSAASGSESSRSTSPDRVSDDPGSPVGTTALRGLPSRRTLLVLLGILVVAGVIFSLVGGSADSDSPPLATSCTTPAAAVGAVNNSSNVRYSLTGPAVGTYIITIDAATAKVHGDGVDLTPAGATAIAIKKNLKDCMGNGALPSADGSGHELVIFRDGTIVARAKIPG